MDAKDIQSGLSRTTGHKVQISNRNSGNISGVVDVIYFDLKKIQLETTMGVLTINGDELHVKRVNLDRGEIDMEGHVDNFVYTSANTMKGKSVMKRLFK